MEEAGNLTQAIDCYRRGTEADDLVEAFYQGLMRCYRTLGMRAEATMAYRRMHENLSFTPGTLPSPDS